MRSKIAIAAFIFLTGASFSADAAKFKTIHAFCATDCSDGSQPNGRLIADPAGRLYGVISKGGLAQSGSVVMIEPHGATGKLRFEQIYDFKGIFETISNPRAGLAVDTAGNLYGVAQSRNSPAQGVLYELSPNARRTKWTFKVLYEFCPSGSNCVDGAGPISKLTYAGEASGLPYDGASPLFGNTLMGGNTNNGTVFELVPTKKNNWTESVIHHFCLVGNCIDGSGPIGDLTLDSSGNIFGTTQGGGALGDGTVFQIGTGQRSRPFTVLHDFCSQGFCDDGEIPQAGVALDGAGNLYGTSQGGPNHGGVIYKLVPQGSSSPVQILHSFCIQTGCPDGDEPLSSPILDSSGNIFGTTHEGGAYGPGTVYTLDTNGHFKTLHSFCKEGGGCPQGALPDGALLRDASGHLFGMTTSGSQTDFDFGGTIYELTP